MYSLAYSRSLFYEQKIWLKVGEQANHPPHPFFFSKQNLYVFGI